MVVLVLVGLYFVQNYVGFAQEGESCDVCYENGLPKEWSGPYIHEGVFINNTTTPDQRWDVVYMTRSCIKNEKVELHFKVVGIKSPINIHNDHWAGLQSFMPPIHDYLLGDASILAEFGKHSITLAQGQTMKVRLYQSRCWMFHECVTTQCYENTQELTYPCGPPCCEYEFDVKKTCIESNFIVTPIYPVSTLDGLGVMNSCPEQLDPDVCKPDVCNPTDNSHNCTSNYGGCIPYYHTKK